MIINDEYFKERAHKLWDEMRHEKYADDKQAIYLLLKEVARDVKHECAEVQVKFDPGMGYGYLNGVSKEFQKGYSEGFNSAISAYSDACMNV